MGPVQKRAVFSPALDWRLLRSSGCTDLLLSSWRFLNTASSLWSSLKMFSEALKQNLWKISAAKQPA